MKKLISTLVFLFMLPLHSASADESPKVVVSIKPIHSLVSTIMEGVGEPTLIVKSGSPHGYSLRPSEASALEQADLVVWVGHELESFLEKPLQTLSSNAKNLELAEQLASSLLAKQVSGNWESHNHDEHDEHTGHDEEEHEGHDHDEHKDHDAHEGHDHDEHKDHDEHEGHDDHDEHKDHDEHEGHDEHEASLDFHIWLSPKIAQKIAHETSKMLIEIDPANAQQYKANTEKLNIRLIELDKQLEQKLAPVKDVPYLVFHAAYQYFETSYNLNAVGSVTIDPDRKPGVKRLTEIRKKVHDLNAHNVFSEPQFKSSLVETIIEGTDAKTGVLDPLGANIPAGPNAYFLLMNRLADNLVKGLM